ncbi:MAG: hypothetical protein C0608_03815 [Deltaproteobacteria bacterium]|nr:MAG: hypothetical protein C0608_03815 [Deltaproteobacteria bacterium]
MTNHRAALLYVGAALLIVLLLPFTALAWGPATHLEISGRILAGLHLVPEAVSALLSRFPLDFYYGSIAADIVVAKKMAHYLHHCHRWVVGLEILEAAETDSQEAFAWGYLTHLAADVVAHNYFVPMKTILSFPSGGKNHTYWEVRFDSYAPDEVWSIPGQISSGLSKDNDELLKKVISRQFFSFRTNKTLFSGMVLLGRSKSWQSLVKKSRGEELLADRVEMYKGLSVNAALSFLCQREEGWAFRADPTGEESLASSSIIANKLSKALKQGQLTKAGVKKIIDKYTPHLEASIYSKANADRLVNTAAEIIAAEKIKHRSTTRKVKS